jgi:hypothetical protein
MDVTKMHEWLLAINHREALAAEDYETCQQIQAEVNRRIAAGTLNKSLMQGFRYYNPETQRFEGQPDYTGLNGLFNNQEYNCNN